MTNTACAGLRWKIAAAINRVRRTMPDTPSPWEREHHLACAFQQLEPAEIVMLLHEYDPDLLKYIRRLPDDEEVVELSTAQMMRPKRKREEPRS